MQKVLQQQQRENVRGPRAKRGAVAAKSSAAAAAVTSCCRVQRATTFDNCRAACRLQHHNWSACWKWCSGAAAAAAYVGHILNAGSWFDVNMSTTPTISKYIYMYMHILCIYKVIALNYLIVLQHVVVIVWYIEFLYSFCGCLFLAFWILIANTMQLFFFCFRNFMKVTSTQTCTHTHTHTLIYICIYVYTIKLN